MNNSKTYALVTGGSSGMGLEYVRQLAARGYNVIIAALPGTVEQIAGEMCAKYPELDFVPVGMDLGCENSAEELMKSIAGLRPEAVIDVLVNNAGLISVKHFREMSVSRIQTELILHNLTTTKLCHMILPEMRRRGHGFVLNVSSLAAWLPFPFISTYSATKAYNRIFTKALRTEYTGTGVRIATVYFGAVDTPLYRLSERKRRLARNLGVMITPERAVKVALRMLFAGRSGRMPGLVNHIALVVCPLLPRHLVAWIDRKVTSHIEKNKYNENNY